MGKRRGKNTGDSLGKTVISEQTAVNSGRWTENSERKGGTDKRYLLVRETEGGELGATDKLRLSVPPSRGVDNVQQ